MIVGAKALLLSKDVKCNTQIGIINDFETNYVSTGEFVLEQDFTSLVLQINQNEPTAAFAQSYLKQATDFMKKVIALRKKQLGGNDDKTIIDNYYRA
jgi:sulfite reductase (ferredoxin)